MRWLQSTSRRFLRDTGGATSIEYALIATGIAVTIIAAVNGVGTAVLAKYQGVSDALK
ncbi:MAG: Flp family type IVb pilin [Pseudorhodoplanes sp.]